MSRVTTANELAGDRSEQLAGADGWSCRERIAKLSEASAPATPRRSRRGCRRLRRPPAAGVGAGITEEELLAISAAIGGVSRRARPHPADPAGQLAALGQTGPRIDSGVAPVCTVAQEDRQ